MFHPLRGKHFINAITVPLSANDFAERKKERKRESKVLTEKIIVSVRSRGKGEVATRHSRRQKMFSKVMFISPYKCISDNVYAGGFAIAVTVVLIMYSVFRLRFAILHLLLTFTNYKRLEKSLFS